MIPILFDSNAKTYDSNGLGRLTDAISCEVIEERNGSFELEMSYPVDGIHFDDIQQRSIIYASHDVSKQPQPFRVYRITKPFNGICEVYAHHISYDLSGAVLTPFTANSAVSAMEALNTKVVSPHGFTFSTDKSVTANMIVSIPTSLRYQLGGVSGSVLDTYGGEFKFNKFNVQLLQNRGEDRGVVIRYGKNLVDVVQEENCASVYTGVYPYWKGKEADDTDVVVEGSIVSAGTFDYEKILVIDCSQHFETKPTPAMLNTYAESYITTERVGIPKISLDVSFAQLAGSTEYNGLPLLESVYLCDTVTVLFEKLGVSATAKVVKTVYNVLLDRYDSVEVGDAKTTIADTIAQQQHDIENIEIPEADVTRSMMAEAIRNATALITGNTGGYVVLHASEFSTGGEPDEILILDKPHITGDDKAVNVWRWNKNGLGFSNTGYDGTYATAITADGKIVADFITTGQLNASIIKSGLIENLLGNFKIDLDGGKITITGTKTFTSSDYTMTDADRCAAMVIGKTFPTWQDLEKYDTNNTGNLTVTNVVQIQQFALGNIKRLDVQWKVEISPTDGLVISKSGKRDSTVLPSIEMLRIAGNAGAFTSVTADTVFSKNNTTEVITLGNALRMYAPSDNQTARANLYMRSDNKAELIVDKLTVRDGITAVFG